jgi:hypothetical protein
MAIDTIIQDGRGWETAHPRPIWLKLNPNNKKIEFEPEKNRFSALHFLRLNCIISV